jgi:acetyltransferase-like isoleucine patch superfamily enzyme
VRKLRRILQRLDYYRPRGHIVAAFPIARYDAWRLCGAPDADIQLGGHCIFEGAIICDRTGANDVLISWGVSVVDHDSHALDFDLRRTDVTDWYHGSKDWCLVAIAPVTICDKAWVGFGATILKGVTVGEGAIVGARAVVTRDVAPWTVVAGNLARVLRNLEPRK